MQTNHVVVWLDHNEAHVIAFNRDDAEKPTVVHAPKRHDHHRTDSTSNSAEHPEFFEKIIALIRNTPEWLIVGPASAKLAFSKHLHKRHADLVDHVVGIETVDHPSDGQLLAFAKKYFTAADRMSGVPTPT
jgi:stalled ribosome rescue protein Dom34